MYDGFSGRAERKGLSLVHWAAAKYKKASIYDFRIKGPQKTSPETCSKKVEQFPGDIVRVLTEHILDVSTYQELLRC